MPYQPVHYHVEKSTIDILVIVARRQGVAMRVVIIIRDHAALCADCLILQILVQLHYKQQ